MWVVSDPASRNCVARETPCTHVRTCLLTYLLTCLLTCLLQAENARLAAEAKKVKMYTRRTGGGFVVSFAREEPTKGEPPEDAPADA